MSGIRSLSCCVARLANFISFWFLKNGGSTAGMFSQKKNIQETNGWGGWGGGWGGGGLGESVNLLKKENL